MNERFAAVTRSASFVLNLSDAQIRWLLADRKTRELAAKYPWYAEQALHHANFGRADELAMSWSSSTVRSLVRRGLVDVCPTDPPCTRFEVIRVSKAGELVTDLLVEAGFEVSPQDVPSVGLHPDDRAKMSFSDSGRVEFTPFPPDRRDPADADYLSWPRSQRADATTDA